MTDECIELPVPERSALHPEPLPRVELLAGRPPPSRTSMVTSRGALQTCPSPTRSRTTYVPGESGVIESAPARRSANDTCESGGRATSSQTYERQLRSTQSRSKLSRPSTLTVSPGLARSVSSSNHTSGGKLSSVAPETKSNSMSWRSSSARQKEPPACSSPPSAGERTFSRNGLRHGAWRSTKGRTATKSAARSTRPSAASGGNRNRPPPSRWHDAHEASTNGATRFM